jgi:CheY-like chemotaxis protein
MYPKKVDLAFICRHNGRYGRRGSIFLNSNGSIVHNGAAVVTTDTSFPKKNPQQQHKLAFTTSPKQKEQSSLSSFIKTILIVDDDPDITLTFKKALEMENQKSDNKTFFKVYTYNYCLLALSEFKPNFYDLLLIDINMPTMNGFEFSTRILELDINVRVCYITAGEVNIEALREQYPTLSFGCFIKKPVTTGDLVQRVKAELE